MVIQIYLPKNLVSHREPVRIGKSETDSGKKSQLETTFFTILFEMFSSLEDQTKREERVPNFCNFNRKGSLSNFCLVLGNLTTNQKILLIMYWMSYHGFKKMRQCNLQSFINYQTVVKCDHKFNMQTMDKFTVIMSWRPTTNFRSSDILITGYAIQLNRDLYWSIEHWTGKKSLSTYTVRR